MRTNIMFWNCQVIRPKRKELELYLIENNVDIVVLNETFLIKKIDFKIQGYDTNEALVIDIDLSNNQNLSLATIY